LLLILILISVYEQKEIKITIKIKKDPDKKGACLALAPGILGKYCLTANHGNSQLKA